jgi:thymidylate synthase
VVTVVKGETALEAWQKGCKVLLSVPKAEIYNLVTQIDNPALIEPEWFKTYSPKAVGEKDTLSVVAKVLFPTLARKPGETRIDYYGRCKTLLMRGRATRALSRPSWGTTYFERLCSLDGSDNQIERAITVLNNWTHAPKAAIVIHLSSPRTDRIMKMGSPCLQYIEITVENSSRLNLLAVYRNHDFLSKAFGNFIGLGRLLSFIAAETETQVGCIVCHSAHAMTTNRSRLKALSAKVLVR